jgi:hypothetical protein
MADGEIHPYAVFAEETPENKGALYARNPSEFRAGLGKKDYRILCHRESCKSWEGIKTNCTLYHGDVINSKEELMAKAARFKSPKGKSSADCLNSRLKPTTDNLPRYARPKAQRIDLQMFSSINLLISELNRVKKNKDELDSKGQQLPTHKFSDHVMEYHRFIEHVVYLNEQTKPLIKMTQQLFPNASESAFVEVGNRAATAAAPEAVAAGAAAASTWDSLSYRSRLSPIKFAT